MRGTLDEVRRAYAANCETTQVAAVEALATERLPYEEYVLELTLLGLRDGPYSGDDYARGLGRYLGWSISIAVLSNAQFLQTNARLAGRGASFGRLTFSEHSDEASIELPGSLSPWLHEHTLFHELGHLAAGHPPRLLSGGHRLEPPHEYLARREPLVSGLPQQALDDLYEAEADLRAEYAIITGSLGQVAIQTSRLTQIS